MPIGNAADGGGILACVAERPGRHVAVVAAVGDRSAMAGGDASKGRRGLIGLAEGPLRNVQVAATTGDGDPTCRLGTGGRNGDRGNGSESGEAGEEDGAHDTVSFKCFSGELLFRMSMIDKPDLTCRPSVPLWSSQHRADLFAKGSKPTVSTSRHLCLTVKAIGRDQTTFCLTVPAESVWPICLASSLIS